MTINLVTEPFRRSICAVCQVIKQYHLLGSDHVFVPGDMPIHTIAVGQLRPGDIVAEVKSDRIVSVYRRP